MRYFVCTQDGNKYGPADTPLLQQWITEGRLVPGMVLEAEGTGERLDATAHPGLSFYPAMGPSRPQQFAPYQPHMSSVQQDLQQAWVFGVISLFCCGPLAIIGLIKASSAQQKGSIEAKGAMILNVVALVAWALGGAWFCGRG